MRSPIEESRGQPEQVVDQALHRAQLHSRHESLLTHLRRICENGGTDLGDHEQAGNGPERGARSVRFREPSCDTALAAQHATQELAHQQDRSAGERGPA